MHGGAHCISSLLQSTFSAGLTLELLHAQSANEKWEPTFLSVVTKIVNKVSLTQSYICTHLCCQLVVLKNLAAYWDTDDKPLHYKDQADMGQLMESLIHQDGDGAPAHRLHPPHSYLIKPINAQLRAVLNTNNAIDMKIPKLTLILTVLKTDNSTCPVFSYASARWRNSSDG